MTSTMRRHLIYLALLCVISVSAPSIAQSPDTNKKLQLLTDQRMMLTAELDQFRETLRMVHPEETPPEQSPNSAVRTLAIGAVDIKERLIEVTEQEINLLQQQIRTARDKIRATQQLSAANKTDALPPAPEAAPASSVPAAKALELQAADIHEDEYTLAQEAENVERLHNLLQSYYLELEESASILPTTDEIARRELAQRDAQTLEKIPFSVDKVRLSGSEGSTALAQISQRLVDPRIPESRRDIAPICNIKTRLLDTLISVENRSLKPVGKNHFIGRVSLQPGETTISILSDQWAVQLPEHAGVQDFLITLYRPVDGASELHVFAVTDLLAQSKPHIPAWLPEELDIKMRAG